MVMTMMMLAVHSLTLLLCFSDVSVELPFTLMHAKPLEETSFMDGGLFQ